MLSRKYSCHGCAHTKKVRALQNADVRRDRLSSMELLSIAILIVLIGALLSIGWQLAPLILVGGIVYVVFRYRREIPVLIKKLFREVRSGRRK